MKILVVCFGNACRSPMLTALLKSEINSRELLDQIKVESAGVKEKDPTPASDNARETMRERGIDISSHRSRNVKGVPDLKEFDHIYCMEQGQVDTLIQMGVDPNRVHLANAGKGGVPNPYPQGMDVYRACADVLEDVAKDIVDELTRELNATK